MRGCMDCPYHSGVEVVATQLDRLRALDITEEAIKRSPVVGQKGAPQLLVSKEAMIATMKMDAEQMIQELTGQVGACAQAGGGKHHRSLTAEIRSQGRGQKAPDAPGNGPMAG